MPEPVCTLCNGRSWIEQVIDNEVVPFRCVCFKKKLALSFLGPELSKVPARRSGLYRPEIDPQTNEIIGDRTLDDLFIKGAWEEVAQHLRWAVGAKNYDDPSFTFRMVTDDMLLRVWLGDYAYKSRSRNVRDDIETYNNPSDLVAPCSLFIVRLGNLGHPNRAAGNVLLECLNIRASASKPTWLVEGSRAAFGEGHGFYNYDVGHFIEDNFETINVGGDVESERRMEAELQALAAQSFSMGDEDADRPVQPAQTTERFYANPGDWERDDARKATRKWGKNKRGGGLGTVKI